MKIYATREEITKLGFEHAKEAIRDSGCADAPDGGWDSWILEGWGSDATVLAFGEPLKDNQDGWSNRMNRKLMWYHLGAIEAAERFEAIRSDLIQRNEFFHGGHANQTAGEWAEAFCPSDAASWMDVGFWDAATAETLSHLGYTPAQIKAISDDQTERNIKYNSGDLIYALCNSDASSDCITL
jgi:hypothetical protein